MNHDERAAHQMGLTTGGGASASFVDGADEVRPAIAQDRNEPKENAGEQRKAGREQKHFRMEPDLVETRDIVRAERDETAERQVGKANTEDPTERRERETLSQKELHRVTPASTER